MGDFNFTSLDNDRFSHEEPKGWRKADPEAKVWNKEIIESNLLSELYQPLATYNHTSRMTRLDRIYSSAPDSKLCEINVSTKILHQTLLSDHKPVVFRFEGEKLPKPGMVLQAGFGKTRSFLPPSR